MQDRRHEQVMSLPLMLKEAYSAEKRAHEDYSENMSEAFSFHDFFYDSLSGIQDGEVSNELSAFLSKEEISKSLDLAREAIANSVKENQNVDTAQTLPEQQKEQPPTSSQAAKRCSPNMQKTSPKSKSMSQGDAPFRNKLCDKAVMFIEELSSIFREAAKARGRSPSGDSSSPDSGYLSPKKKQSATINASVNQSSGKACPEIKPEARLPETHHNGELFPDKKNVTQENETAFHHELTNPGSYQSSAPRFTRKLRSQEVAEGSKVLLECRVAGNPTPHVRWFCEGKELQNSPDIQIHCESGGLHSLVIAEAFEDDTGRYTCLASNSVGSDSTSAEVFIEGKKKGKMKILRLLNQLGIAMLSSAILKYLYKFGPKSHFQRGYSPTSYLYRLDGSKPVCSTPIFTKELQNSTASEGQVVVLECRIRGAPPLHVKWFRQGVEIQDSPDFRILQKKPRSAAEPEEICTLVIAETFPEDAGTFTCTATNEYGSVASSAQLTVCSGIHELSTRESNSDDFQYFPPPPPVLEISSLELPPKKHTESQQVNNTEFRPNIAAVQLQFNSAEKKTSGIHPSHEANGVINRKASSDKSASTPAVLLSPTKEPPPVLAKPKL
uniref:Ig-like domain-containing protein n=1 Tax=Chelonoidis abingdonii TaxID=106734 RepID=A0A8C0JGC7_CHEAB